MKKYFIILSSILIALLLLFFHTHGFISYDDGWFLQGGLRLLQGERIYKDFHYLYNPGSLYLNALAFTLFGKSILASRLIAFCNSLISVFILLYITKKLRLQTLLSFVLVFGFIFWGPGQINFVWPVMFCVTFALASGALFLSNVQRDQKRQLLLIGAFAAGTFILKQNFGLAIFAATILYLFLIKQYRNTKSFLWFSIGYAIVIFLEICYLLFTHSLFAYLHDFYFYTFVQIFQHHILNSSLPWQYPSSIFAKLGKILLYFSPLGISFITSLFIFKSKKDNALYYFPLISCFYFALSIRPTTDFIHLTPLLSLCAIQLAILFILNKKYWSKILINVVIILFCILGFYSAFFRNYYRWNTPLIHQTVFVSHPRVMIWTDITESENISQISTYYQIHAKNEPYTFIYSFTPVYYLILNKRNPTMYDDVQLGISPVEQQRVVQDLKAKSVIHIMTDNDMSHDSTVIAGFIKTYYVPVKQIHQYIIWTKKTT